MKIYTISIRNAEGEQVGRYTEVAAEDIQGAIGAAFEIPGASYVEEGDAFEAVIASDTSGWTIHVKAVEAEEEEMNGLPVGTLLVNPITGIAWRKIEDRINPFGKVVEERYLWSEFGKDFFGGWGAAGTISNEDVAELKDLYLQNKLQKFVPSN